MMRDGITTLSIRNLTRPGAHQIALGDQIDTSSASRLAVHWLDQEPSQLWAIG
jgi:hypothetical protein